jgi:hypothetical protein
MNRRIEPLSPEERDLAERLARLGGPREPAPALDAAILAAARAAVAPDAPPAPVAGPAEHADTPPPAAPADPKVTPLRPRRSSVPRWPLGFGLAASLVLAAGIGWKLQGDGDGSSAEYADAAAPAAEASASADAAADEAMEAIFVERPAPPPPPPPLQDTAASPLAGAAAPARTQAKSAPMAPTAPMAAADAIADAPPAPVAPAAAAMPEPEAKIAVERDGAGLLEASGGQAPRSEIPVDRNAAAAEYTRTPLSQRREQIRTNRAAQTDAAPPPPPPPPAPGSPRDRARQALGEVRGATTAETAANSDAFDDRPPVTADSPEFRQAWLQRIRTLLANGDTAAAGQSLQEFRRRYPDVELPEDLRKLAATLPAP